MIYALSQRINIIFGVLALICGLMSLSGCAYHGISHGAEITDEQVATIIDGSTTKQQVILSFGDPTKTMDKEKVFFYTWTRGSKASFMGFGGGQVYTYSLTIVFDENGIVSNHRVTRGSTAGGATAND